MLGKGHSSNEKPQSSKIPWKNKGKEPKSAIERAVSARILDPQATNVL